MCLIIWNGKLLNYLVLWLRRKLPFQSWGGVGEDRAFVIVQQGQNRGCSSRCWRWVSRRSREQQSKAGREGVNAGVEKGWPTLRGLNSAPAKWISSPNLFAVLLEGKGCRALQLKHNFPQVQSTISQHIKPKYYVFLSCPFLCFASSKNFNSVFIS